MSGPLTMELSLSKILLMHGNEKDSFADILEKYRDNNASFFKVNREQYYICDPLVIEIENF